MTSRDYRSSEAMSTSLSQYAQSQSTDQRCARLKAMVIRAKEAGNVELLATLRTQWESLKTEMMAEDAQNVAAALVEETTDQPTANATNKAALHLSRGVQPVEVQPGVYLVPSGTRAGTVHRVTTQGCSCEAGKAGKVCWHPSHHYPHSHPWCGPGRLNKSRSASTGPTLPSVETRSNQ